MYGIALTGLPDAAPLLRPIDEGCPALSVDRRRGATQLAGDSLDDDRAAYRLPSAEVDVVLDRAAGTAALTSEHDLPDQAVLHPFLALASAIVGRWARRDAFHAGVFVRAGGAWVVLGAREAGKSSLVAQLHLLGAPVLADDLAVLSGDRVLGGPASIDLRRGAAEHLGLGEPLGRVGGRERWRVRLPNDLPGAPLRGFVLPCWGSATRVVPVPLPLRLPLLTSSIAVRRPPVDPERFFSLVALPFYEFRRPRDFACSADAARLLLDQIDDRHG